MHGSTDSLIRKIKKSLRSQGYRVDGKKFYLPDSERDTKRSVQAEAKLDRLFRHKSVLERRFQLCKSLTPKLEDIDVEKIAPELINISKSGNKNSELFLWWNLVWWSLPYEKSYGRQMRYIVWDRYHDAPIGLIGLHSPILKWKPRDDYLQLKSGSLDYWVNQSLSAQRLGALPPYNLILGGKLTAGLVTAHQIRNDFNAKYKGTRTKIANRRIPARLLFVTTTGAFGSSSIYTRLSDANSRRICKKIGQTSGSGSFHISQPLYEELINYLKAEDIYQGRYYGSGPSKRLKNIDVAMRSLGFQTGADHGVKRSIYIFPLVSNLSGIIHDRMKPDWCTQSVEEITNHWKQRWAAKRIQKIASGELAWNREEYFESVEEMLENCGIGIKQ